LSIAKVNMTLALSHFFSFAFTTSYSFSQFS
jgi:hypothetical protein